MEIVYDKKQSLAPSEALTKLEAKTRAPKNEKKTGQERTKEGAETIDPKVRVVRAIVTYVDVKLARQFADALEDSNIMLSFATGFFGATISFMIAFITSQTSSQSILFGTSTAFCVLLTAIFIALAVRNRSKVKKIKKHLEGF